MQNRQYSSISQDTTLSAGGISATATSMTVASGTGSALMGGITLTTGDTFSVALDPDTINEEIVFITAQSGDTFTIVRGRANTSNVIHGAGATVRHVMSSDDLNWFNTTSPGTLSTAKGDIIVATGVQAVDNLPVGSNNQVLVADSAQTFGVKWADTSTVAVSGVTAGTGLTGGGTSGNVTVSLSTPVSVANGGTGITSLGSGVATFLGTPSSANLAAAVTDETGSGSLVFGTSPTLTTPVITTAFNAQVGTTYTLVASDASKFVTASNASAITITVPPSVFSAGQIINLQQIGAGQVTFAAGAGVTITSTGATAAAPKTRVQYSACSIICTASNTFTIVGDIA